MQRIARGQSGVKWPQRREVKPAHLCWQCLAHTLIDFSLRFA